MDMRAWSPVYAGSEILEPPVRRVLVAMRDHALRRIVASVLRRDGIDAIEAFDENQTLEEIRRVTPDRRIEAVLVDARREPDSVAETIARVRAADSRLSVIALVVRRDDEFVATATSRGAVVLRLPMTSRDLRATLDAAAGTSNFVPGLESIAEARAVASA